MNTSDKRGSTDPEPSDDGGLAETERRHSAHCRAEEARRTREAEILAAGFDLGKAAVGRLPALPETSEAERTVASIATMLGWMNVPPRETLERDIAALKARASAQGRLPALDAFQDGIALMAAERQRQIAKEDWTPDHDDRHDDGELASAAIGYIQATWKKFRRPPANWPWDDAWWKPSADPIRNLVKAGALIAAEIDRLQRAGLRADPAPLQVLEEKEDQSRVAPSVDCVAPTGSTAEGRTGVVTAAERTDHDVE